MTGESHLEAAAGGGGGAPIPLAALVRNSGTFTVPSGVITDIQWQSEDLDDDNFTDLLADDTIIMTVPPAYAGRRAFMYFSGYWSNAAIAGTIREIAWSISSFPNLEIKHTIEPVALNRFFTLSFGPYVVASGDVFKVTAFQDAGANRTIGRAYASVVLT